MNGGLPDFLMRAVLKKTSMRLAIGSFRDLASTAIIRHDADPVAGRLLADALSAAALLSAVQGNGERATIRIGYPGPVGMLVVEANEGGSVRGFVRNPHVMSEADSVEAACGDAGATVRFTRSREGKILSSGESENAFLLPSSALACHLSASEDIESEIRCEIILRPDPERPVESACGVLLQAQAGCDLEEFALIRDRLQTAAAGELLRSRLGAPEEILRPLLAYLLETPEIPDFAVTRLPAARFRCGCTAEHLRKTAVQMLGREELEQLLRENPNPALRCQFCNAEYHLSAADLANP